MKRILSIMLTVAMLSTLLVVNVSAHISEGEVIISQNYEDAENTVFGGGSAVAESEDSENKVFVFDTVTKESGFFQNDIFKTLATEGIKVSFKLQNTDKAGAGLIAEIYAGDGIKGNYMAYYFKPCDYADDTWYQVDMYLGGGCGTSKKSNLFYETPYINAYAKNLTTNAVQIAGSGKTTLSTNTYTDKTVEPNVTYENYYSRMRFLWNPGVASEGIHHATDNNYTKPTTAGWMIDDITITKIDEMPSTGCVFYQDFELPSNTFGRALNYTDVYSMDFAANGRAKEVLVANNTDQYKSLAATVSTFANTLPETSDTTVLSFDVCKKAPSAAIVVLVPWSTGGKNFGIPAKQMRQDVWYTYAVYRKANDIRVYRKVKGTETWTELTACTNENAAAEPTATTQDVEAPIYISDASTGSSDPQFRVFTTSNAKHIAWNGGDTAFAASGADINGSHYIVDNIKYAKGVDAAADFSVSEGIVTAKVNTSNNVPNSSAELKTFFATYDANNALVDVDFAVVDGTEKTLSAAAGASAKVFVLDADLTPAFEEAWTVTSFID